jgi:hypothetical protein
VAGRPVSLAPRPPLLAGREELLADLDARLAGDAAGEPSIIALYGLGGAGKTSVAVEYAHRHQAAAGVVWPFPAEDGAVLAAEFGRLAGQLGVGGGLLDRRDPVASVHAVLAAAARSWLLVFDNAPDLESVRAFLPSAGDGLVLITSQSALWPPGQSVEVPVLGVGAAAGFLTARTGDPDERAAGELATELGGLPLALEQAAAYVHATGDTLAGYLASFRQRRLALLRRGEPAGYDKTVASTWALAFDRLRQTEQGAVGLLRLLASCAPEAVPWRLLLQPRPGLTGRLGDQVIPVLAPLIEDPLAAGDAIRALRRYSLITPAAAGSVSVHRRGRGPSQDHVQACSHLPRVARPVSRPGRRSSVPASKKSPCSGYLQPTLRQAPHDWSVPIRELTKSKHHEARPRPHRCHRRHGRRHPAGLRPRRHRTTRRNGIPREELGRPVQSHHAGTSALA